MCGLLPAAVRGQGPSHLSYPWATHSTLSTTHIMPLAPHTTHIMCSSSLSFLHIPPSLASDVIQSPPLPHATWEDTVHSGGFRGICVAQVISPGPELSHPMPSPTEAYLNACKHCELSMPNPDFTISLCPHISSFSRVARVVDKNSLVRHGFESYQPLPPVHTV